MSQSQSRLADSHGPFATPPPPAPRTPRRADRPAVPGRRPDRHQERVRVGRPFLPRVPPGRHPGPPGQHPQRGRDIFAGRRRQPMPAARRLQRHVQPVAERLRPGGRHLDPHTYSGWTTVNNVTYGGVAVRGTFAYATDMFTANDGSTAGLVRFDLTDGSAQRFAAGTEYIDVYLGGDGKLYGLQGRGPIDVYDPDTMTACGRSTRHRHRRHPGPGRRRRRRAVPRHLEPRRLPHRRRRHLARPSQHECRPARQPFGGSWSLDVSKDGTEVLIVAGSGNLVRTNPDLRTRGCSTRTSTPRTRSGPTSTSTPRRPRFGWTIRRSPRAMTGRGPHLHRPPGRPSAAPSP